MGANVIRPHASVSPGRACALLAHGARGHRMPQGDDPIIVMLERNAESVKSDTSAYRVELDRQTERLLYKCDVTEFVPSKKSPKSTRLGTYRNVEVSVIGSTG